MSLTPHDLRAIRHADQLVFRYNTPRHPGGQREDWLECGLDASRSPTGYEQVHAVVLEPSALTVYDGHTSGTGDDRRAHPLSGVALDQVCGSVLIYPRHSSEHQTWLRALSRGSCLTACFVIGNNNAYLEEAGLSQDEAWLLIRRPGSRYDARYYLDSRICPTFSSARMIQPITRQLASAGD